MTSLWSVGVAPPCTEGVWGTEGARGGGSSARPRAPPARGTSRWDVDFSGRNALKLNVTLVYVPAILGTHLHLKSQRDPAGEAGPHPGQANPLLTALARVSHRLAAT